jgi:serine/threonine protein phosphatase 1
MPYATRRPGIADHEILDLSNARRVLVFGDVHGRVDLVVARLAALAFDPAAGDIAICVGDWMDRGPAGLAAMRAFLDANPAILWVRGNHEQILDDACHGHDGLSRLSREQAEETLVRNGGVWACSHLDDHGHADADLAAFSDMLNEAPIAYTVLTPGGRRVGIVHASVPNQSWDHMVVALEGPDPMREAAAYDCMWGRAAADMAIDRRDADQAFGFMVDGIDHVFHGHTRVGREPLTFGNVSWIDTGAYKTDVLTMLDVDSFLDGLGDPSPFAR